MQIKIGPVPIFKVSLKFFEKLLPLDQHNLEVIKYRQGETEDALSFLNTKKDLLTEEGRRFLDQLTTEFEIIKQRIDKISSGEGS